MARPTKQGVDYFPLDVYLDDKFKFIEIKYKLEGFAIVIKLMQRIYANGYWYHWTEDEMLLFSDEIKVDFNLLENVVNECLKRGIFDSAMFEKNNILTSKGIQKRYKEIVRRRKDVEWITDYLLIDDINTSSSGVIDDINPSLSKQDDGKSTQSKVKERKVNKTKENNNSPKQVYDETSIHYQLALFFYEQILVNNPKHKKPNLQTWSDDIRLMMETDDRKEEQIRYLMKWVQQDEFEMVNVLSPSKLRKRFDQLVLKVKREKEKKVTHLEPKQLTRNNEHIEMMKKLHGG